MNISKAKSVMIVVFLGLNIFLIYHLFEPGWGLFDDVISREEKQRLEILLEANNYRLEADVPGKPEKSFFLTVKSPDNDIEKLKKIFFREKSPQSDEREDALVIAYEGAVLSVFGNGLVSYCEREKKSSERILPAITGRDDALNDISTFFSEKELLPEEPYRYEIKAVNGEDYAVVFFQDYSGVPLFSGYIMAVVEKERVVEIRSYLHRVVGMEERQEMKLITAAAALMRLVEDLGYAEREIKITDIAPGFYSREYEAEQWEIPPVWRIVTDGGSYYYINAFTGNIENRERSM